MNEKQKEYSVLEIKKYSLESEQLKTKVNKNNYFIYGSIGLAFIAFRSGNALKNVSDVASHISNIIGWAMVAMGIDNLEKMIFNISKKVGLENAIDRINYEIKMSEFEKSNDKEGPRK